MIRRLWLAVVLFGATPALAEESKVYEGTAGRARIVVQWTEGEEAVTGTYFYRSTRRDIPLSGTWHGRTLDLSSDATGDKISLARQGADMVGVLATSKGTRLAVTLHPAMAPSDLPAHLPAGLDLYARLHLAGLRLVPQEAETRDGKTVRWYREPLTGIRLFRLEGGYAAHAMAAMNRALSQDQWSEVSDWLRCTGPDGLPGAESRADKPWLGAAHVSYIWRASWDCGAHPDSGAWGHSFDAVSGRELKLDEVLPEARAPIPAEDSDAWLDYRRNVFAPAVVALLKRRHPAEMTPAKDDGGCDYTDPEVWNSPSWALTEKGLWLRAYFPRIVRECDSSEWAVIPWSDLPSASAARR